MNDTAQSDLEKLSQTLEIGDTATITVQRKYGGRVLIDMTIARNGRAYTKSGRWDDSIMPTAVAIKRAFGKLFEHYARRMAADYEQAEEGSAE